MLDQELKKIVKLTAHTQRNWDVSVPFPQPHAHKIVDIVVNHPSKESWNENENGINYFDLLVVTDNSIKRAIYDLTKKTNPQVLAPLLLIWVSKYYTANNDFTDQYNDDKELLESKDIVDTNALDYITGVHVGVSGAYGNMMAGSLGYRTGFLKCFKRHYANDMKHILGVDQRIELMLGVGEANETKKPTEHHESSIEYGTLIKEPIKIINL